MADEFKLKTYQTNALDALTLFLQQAATMGLRRLGRMPCNAMAAMQAFPMRAFHTAATSWATCPRYACVYQRAAAKR